MNRLSILFSLPLRVLRASLPLAALPRASRPRVQIGGNNLRCGLHACSGMGGGVVTEAESSLLKSKIDADVAPRLCC